MYFQPFDIYHACFLSLLTLDILFKIFYTTRIHETLGNITDF